MPHGYHDVEAMTMTPENGDIDVEAMTMTHEHADIDVEAMITSPRRELLTGKPCL